MISPDASQAREALKAALCTMVRQFRKAHPNGKIGKKFQAHALLEFSKLGLPYMLTSEDHSGDRIIPVGATIWRTQDELPRLAPGISRLDHVVRDLNGSVIAIIDVESDLDDVKNRSRAGADNYFVRSLARNGDGYFFNSYHSLERMAVAARAVAGLDTSITSFESISSDSPSDHNPVRVPLFLVNCAGSQTEHIEVLQRRMNALDVTLIHPFM